MPQESLPEMLPAFYKYGTLADMSQLARKMALARKAVVEIRAIEDKLEANKSNILDSDFRLAMKETEDYAIVVEGAMMGAIKILKDIERKVEEYQESIKNVVD